MSVSESKPQSFKVGLTPEEKRFYSHLFKTLDTEGTGVITGEKARTTFEKSGLPPAILGEIWQLADRNNLGFLTQFGFCYAMRLIGHTQAGQPPSDHSAETPGPLPKFAGFPSAPTQQFEPQLLQNQSTNGSFMQSQPSAQVPQNTATYQSQPQDPIPPVSSADYQKFSDLFIRTTGSPNNDLSGHSARDIFLKAKLPTPTLGQIWNLVDTENSGKITMPGFIVAMHLIQGLLSGTIKQLPPFLPDTIWQSAQGNAGQPVIPGSRQSSYASVASQQTVKHNPPAKAPSYAQTVSDEWAVSDTMKQQYETIFNNLDKQKTGKLSPDQVAQFLMTSKLGQQDLATVWDLSDIQNTGVFTKLEFSIALFLINKKLSGGALPNIVPDDLLKSLKAQSSPDQHPQQPTQPPQPPQQQQQQPPQQSQPRPLAAQKTSMDDLADVFGSPSPAAAPTSTPAVAPVSTTGPAGRSLQTRASSSDLTPSSELPRVRSNFTSGFKPTSTFGQSLVAKDVASPKEEHPDLLGGDVKGSSFQEAPSQPTPPPVATPPLVSPQSSAPVVSPPPEKKAINYEALRSVPPPPRKTQQPSVSTPPAVQTPPEVNRNLSSASFQSPQPTSQQATAGVNNSDLLADPAISGQLSQATSDIANISNQVKSLGSQTSELHEKKTRAEQELSKILTVKQDIESKLKVLKSSYENEVKQYQEVEGNLVKAKEETEALRSESSIAEAKLNHLSNELNDKQLAMEHLQKENGAIKEKLGDVNAEITELSKQAESVTAENQRLNNQLSVKKSQVQVVIVKKQELEGKLSETIASNKKLQEDIDSQAEEEAKAQREQEALQAKLAEAKSFKPTKPDLPKKEVVKPDLPKRDLPKESSGTSKGIIGAAIGAVAGTGVAATVASQLGKEPEKEPETKPEVEEPEAKDVEPVAPQVPEKDVSKDTSFEDKSFPVESVETPVEKTIEPKEIQSVPASKSVEVPEVSAPVSSTVTAPSAVDPSVAALVDEVKEKPSSDLTGIEDLEKVDDKPEILSSKLEEATNTTGSSVDGTGETPVTSPANSDFQFTQGSMVGMPGVFVGVQRADSLTSSVQNNAALSVRDDNIDEVSDRETIDNSEVNEGHTSREVDNEAFAPPQPVSKEENFTRDSNPESDGDKFSSGVESFEMVNADDVKEAESYGQNTTSYVFKNPIGDDASGNPEDEFPPIKELDYDESSSDDEDFHEATDLSRSELPVVPPTSMPGAFNSDPVPGSLNDVSEPIPGSFNDFSEPVTKQVAQEAPKDEFDSAFDDLEPASAAPVSAAPVSAAPVPAAPVSSAPKDEFDNAFDDLEPAAEQKDIFEDEFSNLEQARVETTDDIGNNTDEFFNNDFTNNNMPDFSMGQQPVESAHTGNDEWEQLFAGFGNSASAQATPQATPHVASEPAFSSDPNQEHHDELIQELVGMGFHEHTAQEALERSGWDVEAATNYLLDNV